MRKLLFAAAALSLVASPAIAALKAGAKAPDFATTGAVGGKEACDVSELARRAPAAERNLGEVGLARPVGVQVRESRRVDAARRHTVDGDSLRAELLRRIGLENVLRPSGS